MAAVLSRNIGGVATNRCKVHRSRTQRACRRMALQDLWDTDGPARTLNGTAHVEQLFSDRIMSILNASDPIDGQPLMLLWAPKSMHYPLEVSEPAARRCCNACVAARLTR